MAAERPRRLVYTSSVAACGYHADNPVPLTEDIPPRGSPEHHYSEQKAACEAELAEITKGSSLEVFILRPCIVAGPKAPALADAMPWRHLPGVVQSTTCAVPLLKMPVAEPGFPMQLVHRDDAAAAIALAATTDAPRADATLQFGCESGYDRDTMLQLSAQRGGDPHRPGKTDELDALMWRAARPGEPSWPSPFGPGRSGWHVECAAIALSRIGTGLDIQGGVPI